MDEYQIKRAGRSKQLSGRRGTGLGRWIEAEDNWADGLGNSQVEETGDNGTEEANYERVEQPRNNKIKKAGNVWVQYQETVELEKLEKMGLMK